MTKGLKCYLAGPMRSANDFGKAEFAHGAAVLRERGWTVTSPSEFDHEQGWPVSWCAAMARDIPLVIEAGTVVMLPGWQESPGTLVEAFVCLVTGGDLYELDESDVMMTVQADELGAAWDDVIPWRGIAERTYGRTKFDGRADWKNAHEGQAEDVITQLRGTDTLRVARRAPDTGHGGMNYDRMREIAAELADLVIEKNRAYGSSFATSGEALRLLYPNGVQPDQYATLLTIARVWDKLGRIATDRDAFGESPWRDVVGYGLLMAETQDREETEG
jgi:hypothetical protein